MPTNEVQLTLLPSLLRLWQDKNWRVRLGVVQSVPFLYSSLVSVAFVQCIIPEYDCCSGELWFCCHVDSMYQVCLHPQNRLWRFWRCQSPGFINVHSFIVLWFYSTRFYFWFTSRNLVYEILSFRLIWLGCAIRPGTFGNVLAAVWPDCFESSQICAKKFLTALDKKLLPPPRQLSLVNLSLQIRAAQFQQRVLRLHPTVLPPSTAQI